MTRGALVAVLVLHVPLTAQVPVTSLGVGYPVDPVDARAAALGNTGIGLLGGSFSIRNPADLILHQDPGFGISLSGEAVSVLGPRQSTTTGRERFPAIRAIVPFSRFAVSLGFRSEFDQDWSGLAQDTLRFDDGLVPFEERREHDGGVSSVDASLATNLGPLGVGVSARRLTGSLRQSLVRTFDAPTGEAPSLVTVSGSQDLSYHAWRFTAGALLGVSDRLVVSGAYSQGGTLTTSVLDLQGEVASESTIDFPASVELGASFRITDGLLLTGALGRSNWSGEVGGLVGGSSLHSATWAGGGLEFRGVTLLGGELPLRLGARRSGLPFSPSPDQQLTESAYSGGFGWEFQEGLAVVDVGLELGSRGNFEMTGAAEDFQRFTLTFTLRQR